MIRGRLLPRPAPIAPWPLVGALVVMPRLGVRGWVEFLIDTGADFTCLHLPDSSRMGFDYSLLGGEIKIDGIGDGGSNYYTEAAGLVFLDTDNEPVFESLTSLNIGVPGQSPDWAPSLLGRDILSRYQFILDIKSRVVIMM